MNSITKQAKEIKKIKKIKLPLVQINRIIERYNPKYRQQKSNLKHKLLEGSHNTAIVNLLMKEIEYMNEQLYLHNKLFDMSKLSHILMNEEKII